MSVSQFWNASSRTMWNLVARHAKAMFVTALSLVFVLVVVPEAARKLIGLPSPSALWRMMLLVLIAGSIVVTGWLICFRGRSYLQARYIRYLVQSIFLTPVLYGLLVFSLLAYVPQLREVYLSIVDGKQYLQGAFGLLFILLLCAVLGCWQRTVGDKVLGGLYVDHGDLTFDRGLLRVLEFKGSLSGVLPLLGLSAGLASLLVDSWIQDGLLARVDRLLGNQLVQDLQKAVDALGWLVKLMPVGIILVLLLIWGFWLGFRYLIVTDRRLDRIVMTVAGILTMIMILVPPFNPDATIAVSRFLGPLAVIAAAMTAIATMLAFLSWLSVRMRAPVTLITTLLLIGYLTVPLILGPGADAQVDRARPPTPDNREVLHEKFVEWLEARPDRQSYIDKGKPYPVLVVAASGGGIYAASAAASFLAELQRFCGGFGQHVFAISGVSGGAVGASIFNALATATDAPAATGCTSATEGFALVEHTERIVTADHLSPVVAILVSDLVRKLPGLSSFTGGIDRADMLQRSFAAAFRDSAACKGPRTEEACKPLAQGDRLTASFESHWSPKAKAPALILNTTWSETGLRTAFAPFPLHANSDGTLYGFDEIVAVAGRARSLIEAAVVSARFPGIVPAWSVDPDAQDGRRRRWNFVDGGYVDNSGAVTALEIYQQLAQYSAAPSRAMFANRRYPPFEIDVRLVLLVDAEPARTFDDINGTNYSDTVAPLGALFNVRSQQSRRAITRAIEQIDPDARRRQSAIRRDDSRIWLVNLEQNVFPLPLGWLMSEVTNNMVGYMLGDNRWCNEDVLRKGEGQPADVKRALRTFVENSCTQKQIIDLITLPR